MHVCEKHAQPWETHITITRHACKHYIEPATLKWTSHSPLLAIYVAIHNHVRILISDAHTRMGQYYVPYAYGTSHTCMGQHMHISQNNATQVVE